MTTPFKALLLGTCIATTASLLATTAMAQTTTIDTPQGNSVIVPDDALEEQPSGGFISEGDYPRFESLENYQTIADTLTAQGYSDIFIQREGPILTVTAQRAGVPIELVYSTANARLVSVDGVETRAEPEGSSAGDLARSPAGSASTSGEEGAEDGTEGGDSPAEGSTDAPDGSDDAGSEEGGSDTGAGAEGGAETDGGTGDGGAEGSGSEGGASEGGESDGSDSGGDSESGGDSGESDSGGDSSDGGSDSGGDSDGGDSDGGEGDSNG